MTAPHAAEFRDLNPIDRIAWTHFAVNVGLIGGGIGLAASDLGGAVYWVGQLCLALGFAQSFVMLHEAGHRTMFNSRRLNDALGVLSGFIAMIPYPTWRLVHNRHHRYTGWQDLDATTESLTPRPLGALEKIAINVAWRLWLPVFSIIYRVQNYWRIGRISPYLPERESRGRLRTLVALQLALYAVLAILVGVTELFVLVGPGLYLSLMGQDLLILSQHTGMPTNLSHDEHVQPFPPSEQEQFTRSLRLPDWLSWLLLHFDAHELHHLYPAVPGYRLGQIKYKPPNEVGLMPWLREAKALSGTRFLFGNPKELERES